MEIKHFDELFPVDQGFRFEVTVVEQKIDFFGGEGYVECPEGLLKGKVGDPSAVLLVNFVEYLL